MTPKEKAFHLHFSFIRDVVSDNEKAKKCAIKVCDEIHEALKQTFSQIHKKTDMTTDLYLSESIAVHYYQEVKQEIELL